jgi:hypothetical protein
MSVKIIEDQRLWDEFVEKSPYGMLYHRWDFLKVIEKHAGYRLHPYGVYKGEELACVFPIFTKSYLGLRFIFSPPPRTGVPYMGPVISPLYDSYKQRKKESYIGGVVDEVAAEMKKLSPSYTSISTVPGFMDARPFKWGGYQANLYYTYAIDLRKPLNDIWDSMDKDCKREIRTAEKHSLSLKETHDVKTFFGIMKERYIQQGLNFPVMSEEYLEDVLAAFPRNIKMYLLYDSDKVIDVMVNYEYNGRFMFWMGWVNLDKKIHGNEYATWEFLKMKKEEGYSEFEIAGGNTRRLCLFKSKFNPDLEFYYTIEKMNSLGRLAEWAYLNLVKKRSVL